MGIFKYTSDDELSSSCEGWFIKFHTPFKVDNFNKNSPYDIEKTRNSKSIECFCSSGFKDVDWEMVPEWKISEYPNGLLFNTKEEALEKFHKLVKAYGKNLTFEDIFVSIHHCVIEINFKYI